MDYTQQTREHFACLYRQCGWDELAENMLAGKYDHTFTFLQYKHYLETGQSLPLLP